jgi:hypothetical protein
MVRGSVRRPRGRHRTLILLTIAGLALVAWLPAIGSAPGPSRTPWHAPTSPGLAPLDSTAPDPDWLAGSLPEEDPGDPEPPAEGFATPEWMTTRPTGDRDTHRREWSRRSRPVGLGLRPPVLLLASGIALDVRPPRTGVPIRLSRLRC